MNKLMIIDIKNITSENRLINFTESVFAGEQIHLLGANGAGKSTLLSALSGYLPVMGEIWFNGEDIRYCSIAQLAKQRAYFVQLASNTPIIKVFQYLELFLPSMLAAADIFVRLCDDFQLSSLLHKGIYQLSGGEWQRVRVCAAFLQVWDQQDLAGKIILFDEPTNNLDIIQQAMLDKWIKYFCDCQGTVIMSGHDLNHSYKNASRIWLLKQGQLVASGKPAEAMTENNLSGIFETEIKISQSTSYRQWQIINFDD
nr:vitamin B12 ABC transporter ATP-binding protein BtuD [Providencia rettgeri]